MSRTNANTLIHLGEKATHHGTFQEDKIWSRYSDDKVDIGEAITKVIRTLDKSFGLAKPMHALSIGSSDEPQLRILQPAFRGGLYLLDIDETALNIVKERIRRQSTNHVYAIRDDFNKAFLDRENTQKFLKSRMDSDRANLVTLQHSMYYTPAVNWYPLIRNLYSIVLAPKGALYCVLMSSKTEEQDTTTWLYNHFAGKFFAHKNNQDLLQFKSLIEEDPFFHRAQILSKTSRVKFFVDDFEQFMAVVWMILLYPKVHRYTLGQRHEITEYMHQNFFSKKKPLIQIQDHLVIYRGLGVRGII